MIAAVLTKPKTFELQKVELRGIRDNELIIQVEGCGICASSIPLWEGRKWFNYPGEPGSPGHEGWGIVYETGKEIENIRSGDRVAFLSSHGYAQKDIATVDTVVKLPGELDRIPFPGEPLGCAMNIFERSDITAKCTVAIIGSGFLGVLLCQLCKNAGAKVISISKRKYSLQVAKSEGADEVVELTTVWETANSVAQITGNELCPRVIEATGKQEGIDLATEIVAEGGRLIIAGYHQDGLRQINVQKWNWKGIDVINAHERKTSKYISGINKAIEAVVKGSLKPQSLYTHSLPLSELDKGFDITVNRPEGFMKALIQL